MTTIFETTLHFTNWISDCEPDILSYTFDTLEELQDFNRYLNSIYTDDDITSISNVKIIDNNNFYKIIDLDINTDFYIIKLGYTAEEYKQAIKILNYSYVA